MQDTQALPLSRLWLLLHASTGVARPLTPLPHTPAAADQASQAPLIVKSVGGWTRALAQLAEDAPDALHLVQVEGPYPNHSGDPVGAAMPASRWARPPAAAAACEALRGISSNGRHLTQYRLLVAGGVGIVPIAQLLHNALSIRGDAASGRLGINVVNSGGSPLPECRASNCWPT